MFDTLIGRLAVMSVEHIVMCFCFVQDLLRRRCVGIFAILRLGKTRIEFLGLMRKLLQVTYCTAVEVIP